MKKIIFAITLLVIIISSYVLWKKEESKKFSENIYKARTAMQNNNPEAAIMFGQAALRTATNNKESAQGYYILSGLRVFSIEQRDLKKAQGYCLEAFKLDPDFKETNPESPLVLLCEKVIADESIE